LQLAQFKADLPSATGSSRRELGKLRRPLRVLSGNPLAREAARRTARRKPPSRGCWEGHRPIHRSLDLKSETIGSLRRRTVTQCSFLGPVTPDVSFGACVHETTPQKHNWKSLSLIEMAATSKPLVLW